MNPSYRHGYEDAVNDMTIAILSTQYSSHHDDPSIPTHELLSVTDFINAFATIRASRFHQEEISTDALRDILFPPPLLP